MADHPSTFSADNTVRGEIEWDDRAALHENHDGQGILDGAKALRHGSLAEIVQLLMLLPADDRRGYVIQKAGDRMYRPAEVEALAERPDYPFR